MRVLIYFPYNLRTVEQQSVMEMLVGKGHKVVLFTNCERGYLHEYIEGKGIITEWMDNGARNKLANFKKLKNVLKKHEIDVVIAHQQINALIAGLLCKRKKIPLIYIRHNTDEDYQLNSIKAKWYNKLINFITPVKVAPSSVVEKFWIEKEGVSSKQIHRINYGYDFKQYEQPVHTQIEKIKETFPTQLRIVSIARLVPAKRHQLMFAIIKRLTEHRINCKFICLGSGPMENELKEKVISMGMENHIFLLGRKENVFDYIAASDVFMHLSSTEASNSAVKEVALCKKPVLVCKGVGDFDDYIVNNENGFLLSKEKPEEDAFTILKAIAENKIDKQVVGENLFKTVTTIFDIKNVECMYEELLNQVVKS